MVWVALRSGLGGKESVVRTLPLAAFTPRVVDLDSGWSVRSRSSMSHHSFS